MSVWIRKKMSKLFQYVNCCTLDMRRDNDKRDIMFDIPSLILCPSQTEAERQQGFFYKFFFQGYPGTDNFMAWLAAYSHQDYQLTKDKKGFIERNSGYVFSLSEKDFKEIGGTMEYYAVTGTTGEAFPEKSLSPEIAALPMSEPAGECNLSWGEICRHTKRNTSGYRMDDEAYFIAEFENTSVYIQKLEKIKKKRNIVSGISRTSLYIR